MGWQLLSETDKLLLESGENKKLLRRFISSLIGIYFSCFVLLFVFYSVVVNQ